MKTIFEQQGVEYRQAGDYINDLVDFSFHLFYILYRKGIVVVLKNEIPYSKCLNGVLRFFFYIILAILHLERGH